MHISCVRGSPLIRTILVLAALVVAGIMFDRLTRERALKADDQVLVMVDEQQKNLIPAKVNLTFSRFVGFYDLKINGENVVLTRGESGDYAGSAAIDPENPVVFLKVSCVPPLAEGEGRMFAKLVVEADGQETFTHVFDAAGDIDDFVELPF
jgi:hypothetical protein